MKSGKKEKNVITGYLQGAGLFKPATQHDADALRSLGNGVPVELKPMTNARNLAHHRKFWSLINLGYQYFEPEWKMITDAERWIAHKVAQRIAQLAGGGIEHITQEIADEVLSEAYRQRRGKFDEESVKTTEAYLSEVMIRAGFFDTVLLPGGGTAKARWSISFANCSQDRFDHIYKGCAGAIWTMTLHKHFTDEAEMQAAVDQLSGYF